MPSLAARPRSAAAAVGVAGGHQGGDGGLAGLDIRLQGGEPFVDADGHEQGSADVLVAEVVGREWRSWCRVLPLE